MNTTPRNLYSCEHDKLVEVGTAQCQDCARFHCFYTKQANGSYKPFPELGCCSVKPDRGIAGMRPSTLAVGDCRQFVPSDPGAFRTVWLKVEA